MRKYAHLTIPDRAHAVGCPTGDGLETTPSGKPVHGLESYELQKPRPNTLMPDGTIGLGHETVVVTRCKDCGGEVVRTLDEIEPPPAGALEETDGDDG
jgi:hypothetical protein